MLCDDYMRVHLVLGRGFRPAVHCRSSAKPGGPDGTPTEERSPLRQQQEGIEFEEKEAIGPWVYGTGGLSRQSL